MHFELSANYSILVGFLACCFSQIKFKMSAKTLLPNIYILLTDMADDIPIIFLENVVNLSAYTISFNDVCLSMNYLTQTYNVDYRGLLERAYNLMGNPIAFYQHIHSLGLPEAPFEGDDDGYKILWASIINLACVNTVPCPNAYNSFIVKPYFQQRFPRMDVVACEGLRHRSMQKSCAWDVHFVGRENRDTRYSRREAAQLGLGILDFKNVRQYINGSTHVVVKYASTECSEHCPTSNFDFDLTTISFAHLFL